MTQITRIYTEKAEAEAKAEAFTAEKAEKADRVDKSRSNSKRDLTGMKEMKGINAI